MKLAQELIGISTIGLLSGAAVLLASDGAIAAAKVTGVQVSATATGMNLVLKTQGGDRPQVFSVNRGNSWTADLVNTRLQIPGGSYQKANPAAGIASVSVVQLDGNSVRVTVVGQGSAPKGQVNRASNGDLAFSLTRPTRSASVSPKPGAKPSIKTANLGRVTQQAAVPTVTEEVLPSVPNTLAQANTATAIPSQLAQAPATTVAPVAQAVPNPATPLPPNAQPLIPNPTITVQGRPYTPPPPVPPFAPNPIPRAVAPPVGDISVGSVDASPTIIDLGTNERVPRLVLRDASAREALALLSRSVGLNIVYIPQQLTPQQQQQQQGQQGQASVADAGPKISLDIQNEPVQNVFNYILRVAGLEANRVGRTIFVSPRLPDTARNVLTRTIRLNQAAAAIAANFLVTQGAELQIPITRVTFTPQAVGQTGIPNRTEEPDIKILTAQQGLAPLPLRGLAVSFDSNTNSITLSGDPRKIEVASSLLTQLDIRKRQIAVNVRIVDVNLLNTELANTSFSFGVGSNFFSVDGGAALFGFGNVRPPTNSEVAGSLTNPPVTRNLFPTTSPGFDNIDLGPFVDAPQPAAPFGTNSLNAPNSGRAPFGTPGNPFLPGATQINEGRVQFGLPSLFQFPTRFLAQLQAQVVSGNAKILTDPTLAIQEGETSTLALTQQVVSRVTSTFTDTPGGTRQVVEPTLVDAGLILNVAVDRIDDNGFITLRLDPTISAPTQTVVVGGQQTTLLASRRIQSGRIRLRDGQTLILAGVIQDTDRTTIRKVPLLGDIPLLGALFRRSETQNQRQEVVILVTPRILDDSDRSAFGYSYTPGPATREVLQKLNR